MPPEQLAVVGAGIAGLTVAAELAGTGARVTVLDRLPVAGGVLGYEAPEVNALRARCGATGVHWELGTTAIRWVGGRLLTVGPDGIRWQPCGGIIYAGGSRPATQAELRIAGPRLAGVLPASVALHFAEARVLIGRRVVFVGTSDWAHAAAAEIEHHDCEITVVAEADGPPPEFRHESLITGWSATRVVGSGRVSSLIIERHGVEYRLACDAVILGAGTRPLRNVDGAVSEPAAGAAFVQPIRDRTTSAWVAEQARAAVPTLFSESQIEVSV